MTDVLPIGPRLLAIGECMAELAPAEAPGTYRMGFAGDTFNTAWYLARAGVPTGFLSAVGDDPLSDRLCRFAQAAGIDTAAVRRVPGGTVGLYLIALDGAERSFTYWRGQSAARRLADDGAALDRAMAGADTLYLSGITLAILAPEDRARLLGALGRARAAGRTVAFDPNLRPRLWPDGDAMRAAIMAGAAHADLALPSFEDEAAVFGDADPEATVARYGRAGARAVVVKDGAAPVTWRAGGRGGTVDPVPAREVVDTTAAGDSFNAGLLAALSRGAAMPEAVAEGCALAARVVAGRGALVAV